MKFMLIRRADEQTEQGVMPSESLLQAMVDYNERMVKAGVFVSGNGLKPSSEGYRIEFSDGQPKVIAGPLAAPSELVAGYTVLDVESVEEAIEWARQWPAEDAGGQAKLELRRYFELEDFGPGAAIDQHRDMCDKQERLPLDVSTHLMFSGNCREALTFYAELLGGQIRAMLPYTNTPMAEHMPEQYRDGICHAELVLGSHIIMGADLTPDCYQVPRGSEIVLHYEDLAQGEAVFRALEEGGSVRMPFEETFWAQRFGAVTDRFGTGWIINCGIKPSPECPSQ